MDPDYISKWVSDNKIKEEDIYNFACKTGRNDIVKWLFQNTNHYYAIKCRIWHLFYWEGAW